MAARHPFKRCKDPSEACSLKQTQSGAASNSPSLSRPPVADSQSALNSQAAKRLCLVGAPKQLEALRALVEGSLMLVPGCGLLPCFGL